MRNIFKCLGLFVFTFVILFISMFCVELEQAQAASSANCVYKKNAITSFTGLDIEFAVECSKVSYANGAKTHSNLETVPTDVNSFIKNNKLYCPDTIYYKIVNTSGKKANVALSFTKSTGYKAVSLDSSSTVNNDSKGCSTSSNKTVDNTCYYKADGSTAVKSEATYTIKHYNDSSVTVNTKSTNIDVKLASNVKNSSFENSCPGVIYISVSNSGHKTTYTISLTKKTIVNKPQEIEDENTQNTDGTVGIAEAAEEQYNSNVGDSVGCNVLGELTPFLKNLFWVLCVVGIILLIIMTIIEFIKVVTGSDDSGITKALKHTVIRIIVVIILLLLPFIVSFILDIVNKQNGYTIGEDGNPICDVA